MIEDFNTIKMGLNSITSPKIKHPDTFQRVVWMLNL